MSDIQQRIEAALELADNGPCVGLYERMAAAVVAALGLTEEPTEVTVIHFLARVINAEAALGAERAHADKWQLLAGRYDDIRYALRNASDTPEGHAEFYNECARLIFGEAS